MTEYVGFTTEEFRLDPEEVNSVFGDCLAEDDLDTIESDMVIAPVLFGRVNIERNHDLIRRMLMELPEQFRQSGGGGWSFLNACDDRHGTQWTGLHQRMGMLFALGQAAGLVKSLLPRDMWDALPGGMPYYIILDGDDDGRK